MVTQNSNIILIGPVGSGKTTQGKLIAEALDRRSVSLDGIAEDYYKANGFGHSQLNEEIKDKGFLAAYRLWWPSLAYAARKVVEDYEGCVIDFGAGHSHYEDESLYKEVQEALAGRHQIILLLPTEDLDQSVSLLRQRSIDQRSADWIYGGYDFIEHWVKDDCNHELASVTVFTDGKTPDQTCEEILTAIGARRTTHDGVDFKEKQISDIDLHELEQRLSPIMLTVATSHFEGDYKTFQRHHHPIVAEAEFQKMAEALKPYGKPVDVTYLGHLMKLKGLRLLWRVSYRDSKEQLLWQFNIELVGNDERIVSMGID